MFGSVPKALLSVGTESGKLNYPTVNCIVGSINIAYTRSCICNLVIIRNRQIQMKRPRREESCSWRYSRLERELSASTYRKSFK